MKTRHEILMEDPEYRKLYAIEGLVTDAAELVAGLMEEQGVNKAELARRLGKSRPWITQLLSGRANMTIRTFAEVVYALGSQVKLDTVAKAHPQDDTVLRQRWLAALQLPCVASPWKIKPEDQLPFGNSISPSSSMVLDHVQRLERPVYAA